MKEITLQIKEGKTADREVADLTKVFSFGDKIERQFSLQATSQELISVSELGKVKLTSNIDYEEICKNLRTQSCTFESKVWKTFKFEKSLSN